MLASLWIVVWKCQLSAQQQSEKQIKYYELLGKERRTEQRALLGHRIYNWCARSLKTTRSFAYLIFDGTI